MFSEALFTFRQDREHIRQGLYGRPWELEAKPSFVPARSGSGGRSGGRNGGVHRQWSLPWALSTHVEYMGEALRTLDKRSRYGAPAFANAKRNSDSHSPTSPDANDGDGAATEVWLKSSTSGGGGGSGEEVVSRSSGLYPDYYLRNTFHFQTDGWLSSRSARVYETSTETLFIGRQDAMQRHALVPISRFVQERQQQQQQQQHTSSSSPHALPLPLDVLELGAGTGRFHTYLRDNLPLGARTAALDLSPFYLEQAKLNDQRWRRLRGGSGNEHSKNKNKNKNHHHDNDDAARFIHAAAEAVPLADASQDVVVAVYLLHEVPSAARRAIAAEAARLLRPGGLLVLADSIQLGDRPALDGGLGVFSSFNEPHYESYIEEDLGRVFSQNGLLVPEAKLVASSTKVLSFRKPTFA